MSDGKSGTSALPGGETSLPSEDQVINVVDLQKEITTAIESGVLKKENIVRSKTPVPGEVPHARERLIITSIAMVVSLAGAASPWTPENARSGMLSIASVIATALVKPFEKNG